MSHQWSAPGGFFASADFDYEARIMLGAAASGVGDVGLVLAALDRIADGDPQSWFDAWTATAADLAARGDDALRRGHLATASWAFLGAAEYYAKALVFVDGLADQSVLLSTFREHRGCWEKVVDAARGGYVRVPVPYEGTTLPGYLLRPDATGAARPTLVVTNGSDGSLPGCWRSSAAWSRRSPTRASSTCQRAGPPTCLSRCLTCWTRARRTRSTPPCRRRAGTRRRPGPWRSAAGRTA
jgi:hypothetical protein